MALNHPKNMKPSQELFEKLRSHLFQGLATSKMTKNKKQHPDRQTDRQTILDI